MLWVCKLKTTFWAKAVGLIICGQSALRLFPVSCKMRGEMRHCSVFSIERYLIEFFKLSLI